MTPEEKNVVSLREHIESRLISLEKATQLAAQALEKRLEGMNEFREALKNQTNTFVTRKELEIMKNGIDSDIRILRESKATLEGKASQSSVMITLAISILALLVGIVGIIYSMGAG